MESPKKIMVLLPDGVGLRNFVLGGFYQKAKESGVNLVYWNATHYDFAQRGLPFRELQLNGVHPWSQVYKNVRKHVELDRNIQKTKNPVYNSYRFAFKYSTLKQAMKSILAQGLIPFYRSDKAYRNLLSRIENLERSSQFYQKCKADLLEEKPEMVFCTNQRHSNAIAPLVAAKDLGIPTATFIFSWDNIPKATMMVETDYYFVWSDHMKEELLFYYPYVKPEQIFVTGTPQFEVHTHADLVMTREEFFQKYQLDVQKRYICYSGDDVTTSPDDEVYLKDVAQAIRNLNKQGHNFGLIFRRCPVDFSDRYDAVLKEYAHEITPLNPLWDQGQSWSAILPTEADLILQINTIAHTEMVFNLGSSMVFDYAAFGKPCAYMKYVPKGSQNTVLYQGIYNYIHFQSMPSSKAVYWVENSQAVEQVIQNAMAAGFQNDPEAQRWFHKIVLQPTNLASERIFQAMKKIVDLSYV